MRPEHHLIEQLGAVRLRGERRAVHTAGAVGLGTDGGELLDLCPGSAELRRRQRLMRDGGPVFIEELMDDFRVSTQAPSRRRTAVQARSSVSTPPTPHPVTMRRGLDGRPDLLGPYIMTGMTMRYDDVLDPLREAYDARATWRDGRGKEPWKLAERQAFRDRLGTAGRLLEIGAGPGQDSLYFQEEGFDVVAADLSPAMVELCRAKGIEAHVMDFLHLDFPTDSFDAVYALNCLLHVPNRDMPAVLDAIRAVLRPGGLFFVGVYGGRSGEGSIVDDEYVPPRFFSWRTDEQLLGFATTSFEVVDFHGIPIDSGYKFQSLTLRRPDLG